MAHKIELCDVSRETVPAGCKIYAITDFQTSYEITGINRRDWWITVNNGERSFCCHPHESVFVINPETENVEQILNRDRAERKRNMDNLIAWARKKR